MLTITPVRAMCDLDLEDRSGVSFALVEGVTYELHMDDAHLVTEPERFYPCEIHLPGNPSIIGTIDQREAGALIANGSLV